MTRKQVYMCLAVLTASAIFGLYRDLHYHFFSLNRITVDAREAKSVILNTIDGSRPVELKGEDAEQFAHAWSSMGFDSYYYGGMCHEPAFSIEFTYGNGLSRKIDSVCLFCRNFSFSGGYMGFNLESYPGLNVYLTFYKHYGDLFRDNIEWGYYEWLLNQYCVNFPDEDIERCVLESARMFVDSLDERVFDWMQEYMDDAESDLIDYFDNFVYIKEVKSIKQFYYACLISDKLSTQYYPLMHNMLERKQLLLQAFEQEVADRNATMPIGLRKTLMLYQAAFELYVQAP